MLVYAFITGRDAVDGKDLFSITILENELLLEKAKKIDAAGIVVQQGTYSYLKIKDEYIHELYMLLGDAAAQKPDYFSVNEKSIGAHITIAYPEENNMLLPEDIGQLHTFLVKNFAHVVLGSKEYFVLMIASPSLDQLRAKYKLPAKPQHKGVFIDFHITIATRLLQK